MGVKVRPAFRRRGDFPHAIGKKAQWPLCSDAGIELAHSPRCGVARVDEGFLALLALALVEGVKVITAHVDLTPHLQHERHRVLAWLQTQWYLAQRADVLGDLFTALAVAAGGSLHQHTLLVAQVDGQAVELEFCHVLHGRRVRRQAQFLAHPRVEAGGTRCLGVGLGADAEHGHGVAHRGKTVQHTAAHALGGRVGALQFGVGSLQGL